MKACGSVLVRMATLLIAFSSVSQVSEQLEPLAQALAHEVAQLVHAADHHVRGEREVVQVALDGQSGGAIEPVVRRLEVEDGVVKYVIFSSRLVTSS